MNTEFFKIYGSTGRNDGILRLSAKHYVLFFGFGKEKEEDRTGYCWRKDYDHMPTAMEVKRDLVEHINRLVDERILTGFNYEGNMVYLSAENQFNYKAAFDLCMMTDGRNLPVTFKFGEELAPVYKTFEAKETLQDFFTKAMAHVQKTLAAGWKEKDGIDLTVFGL